eukprot:3379658-Rhodomonas_salina.1
MSAADTARRECTVECPKAVPQCRRRTANAEDATSSSSSFNSVLFPAAMLPSSAILSGRGRFVSSPPPRSWTHIRIMRFEQNEVHMSFGLANGKVSDCEHNCLHRHDSASNPKVQDVPATLGRSSRMSSGEWTLWLGPSPLRNSDNQRERERGMRALPFTCGAMARPEKRENRRRDHGWD